MTLKQKLKIKVGDSVTIIAGSDKNKTGKVEKIDKKTGTIIVKGINVKFKHCKPKLNNESGEIRKIEAPIHFSNVKLNLQ